MKDFDIPLSLKLQLWTLREFGGFRSLFTTIFLVALFYFLLSLLGDDWLVSLTISILALVCGVAAGMKMERQAAFERRIAKETEQKS